MSQPNDQELKIYEITHRDTGEKSFQAARTAEDACKQAGWLIDDCLVVAQKPRRKPVPYHTGLTLVKIPCLVCPFQYAECKKPTETDCPVQPNAPDWREWLKQASQAHLCQFYGVELKKSDYLARQKWLPIEEAIEELAPKS